MTLKPESERGDGSLVYVVPFLNDPAVGRRLRMMEIGGIHRLSPVGFRRVAEPITTINDHAAIDLGRTEDARLASRMVSLAVAVQRVGRWGSGVGDVSVIMARTLESLVLADAFRRRFAPHAPLVYESLDIHHLLLGRGMVPSSLRRLEARLLRRCALLITSSPGYIREYFERFHDHLPSTMVLENKVLAAEIDADTLDRLRSDRGAIAVPPAPPWVIGWFGQLRCSRSLELLAELCRQLPDRVRVEIRGRPIAALRAQVESTAAATPGMYFFGPYDRSSDLLEIHSRIHFAWILDFSEAGANGDWALANRLYESGPFGCVPIAFAPVEAGRWLAARGIGLRLDEPVGKSLLDWFTTLTPELFHQCRAAVLRVPLGDFVDEDADARSVAEQLQSLRCSQYR